MDGVAWQTLAVSAAIGLAVYLLCRRTEAVLRSTLITPERLFADYQQHSAAILDEFRRILDEQRSSTTRVLETAAAMQTGYAQVLDRISQTVSRDYGTQALTAIRELAGARGAAPPSRPSESLPPDEVPDLRPTVPPLEF